MENAILPTLESGLSQLLYDKVTIHCSADQAWAYVRDMENYPQWFVGIVQMDSADSLPIATIGKQYDEIGLAPSGKEEVITVKIIEANEQERHLAIRASLEPFVPRFDYRIIALNEQQCVFHWRCATKTSFKATLLRPIFREIIRGRLTKALNNFRRILGGSDLEVMQASLFWRFGAAAQVLRHFTRAARPVAGKGEVVVQQVASSINHIDCHRRMGYGRNAMRIKGALNFPVVLGNDIAGHVVAIGEGVSNYKLGDAVFGVKPPSSDGCFAQYVKAKAEHVLIKPASLAFGSAAALPYTFLTAYCALVNDGGLSAETAASCKVFVQGGAGGVGSMAVQIARYWGAEVVTSCAASQKHQVLDYGAGRAYDFKGEDYSQEGARFDIALCTANVQEQDKMLGILKPSGRYVSVVHPTLTLTDQLGLLKGIITAKKQLKALNRTLKNSGKTAAWALFKPEPHGLALMHKMLSEGKLKVTIDSSFILPDIAQAQQRLESGQAMGKVIVQIA
jgi:reticulon-4-interacting protein 1, mitochondrial